MKYLYTSKYYVSYTYLNIIFCKYHAEFQIWLLNIFFNYVCNINQLSYRVTVLSHIG